MNMLNGAFEMKQPNGNGRLPRGSARSGGQANACLKVLAPMIETAEFYPANMFSAARGGYINATRCADDLVSKELPFRDAYSITGQLVNRCIELGAAPDDLPLEEYLKFSDLFDLDVKALSITENATK